MVVCANILGSCYGSTGPTSIDPDTGKPYGIDFPEVRIKFAAHFLHVMLTVGYFQCTVRDTVRLHIQMTKEQLGINGIYCVVGGSMGKLSIS